LLLFSADAKTVAFFAKIEIKLIAELFGKTKTALCLRGSNFTQAHSKAIAANTCSLQRADLLIEGIALLLGIETRIYGIRQLASRAT
jgi:hypothetical protein